MKDVGYGSDYQYAHDDPDGTTAMETLPERLRGRRYYEPGDLGLEREIKKRMEWWQGRKARLRKAESGDAAGRRVKAGMPGDLEAGDSQDEG